MSRVHIDIADGVDLTLVLEERTDAQERKLSYERAAAFKAKHGCSSCNHYMHPNGSCRVEVGKDKKCPCTKAELRKRPGPVQKKAEPPPAGFWDDVDEEVS
jgi:hypothetical protein